MLGPWDVWDVSAQWDCVDPIHPLITAQSNLLEKNIKTLQKLWFSSSWVLKADRVYRTVTSWGFPFKDITAVHSTWGSKLHIFSLRRGVQLGSTCQPFRWPLLLKFSGEDASVARWHSYSYLLYKSTIIVCMIKPNHQFWTTRISHAFFLFLVEMLSE